MSRVLTPTSLAEALVMLAENREAMPLAGGTDLLVRRRSGAVPMDRPLLDLCRLEELQGIHDDGERLSIGAATSFSRIVSNPLVRAVAPVLADASRAVGGPALRNMSTLGGNIRTASPAGDSLPPLYVLGAQVELASAQAKRTVPIDEFILGPGKTALHDGELILRILLPSAQHADSPVQRFEKIGQRQSMAISVASFCAMARLDADGRIAAARFAWGSVGQTVVRLPALENALLRALPDAATIEQAARMARDGVAPISDLRASADYRRSVAGRLLARFLEELRG